VVVYAVVDDSLSPASPLGDSIDVFVRRDDAERFVEEIRGDEPELATHLRIEERELEAGVYLMHSYANPLMAPGVYRGYVG
jgi:hypothetical protein